MGGSERGREEGTFGDILFKGHVQRLGGDSWAKHSCWLYNDGQKPQKAAPKKTLSPEKGLNSNRGQQSKLKLIIFVSLT